MSGELKRRKAIARRDLKRAVGVSFGEHLAGRSGSVIASSPKRRGRRMVAIGVAATKSGVYPDPRQMIAWRIRNALSPNQRKRPDCIVYNAAGKPIAILDGETRERRPL